MASFKAVGGRRKSFSQKRPSGYSSYSKPTYWKPSSRKRYAYGSRSYAPKARKSFQKKGKSTLVKSVAAEVQRDLESKSRRERQVKVYAHGFFSSVSGSTPKSSCDLTKNSQRVVNSVIVSPLRDLLPPGKDNISTVVFEMSFLVVEDVELCGPMLFPGTSMDLGAFNSQIFQDPQGVPNHSNFVSYCVPGNTSALHGQSSPFISAHFSQQVGKAQVVSTALFDSKDKSIFNCRLAKDGSKLVPAVDIKLDGVDIRSSSSKTRSPPIQRPNFILRSQPGKSSTAHKVYTTWHFTEKLWKSSNDWIIVVAARPLASSGTQPDSLDMGNAVPFGQVTEQTLTLYCD